MIFEFWDELFFLFGVKKQKFCLIFWDELFGLIIEKGDDEILIGVLSLLVDGFVVFVSKVFFFPVWIFFENSFLLTCIFWNEQLSFKLILFLDFSFSFLKYF